ncbi:MAG: hypothetical protein HY226_04440 [Candidatus Vogelbacteria bacterium]|nr:hypothetical protein [Candidatus Vogelbacteria bacterium]
MKFFRFVSCKRRARRTFSVVLASFLMVILNNQTLQAVEKKLSSEEVTKLLESRNRPVVTIPGKVTFYSNRNNDRGGIWLLESGKMKEITQEPILR